MQSLVNCEIILNLLWSANSVISEAGRVTTFAITDTKLPFVSAIVLSTQDNSKLLQQLKQVFKRMIKWNKYL